MMGIGNDGKRIGADLAKALLSSTGALQQAYVQLHAVALPQCPSTGSLRPWRIRGKWPNACVYELVPVPGLSSVRVSHGFTIIAQSTLLAHRGGLWSGGAPVLWYWQRTKGPVKEHDCFVHLFYRLWLGCSGPKGTPLSVSYEWVHLRLGEFLTGSRRLWPLLYWRFFTACTSPEWT